MIKIENKNVRLLNNVSLNFDEVEVFENISLVVPYQKITCIVGPSGCGKTCILNTLSGLIINAKGEINTGEEKIGYIFQEDRLLPWETVYNNIKIVREEENSSEIMELLKALELEEFKDKYPNQLSGGMKQRCAIARGFYYHSTLLLMDEPFKSLDYDLRINLIKYFSKLWENSKKTVIFVTHDIDEALLLGHKVIVLSKRPTGIIDAYNIETKHEKRSIATEEHIELRRFIVNQLTNSNN